VTVVATAAEAEGLDRLVGRRQLLVLLDALRVLVDQATLVGLDVEGVDRRVRVEAQERVPVVPGDVDVELVTGRVVLVAAVVRYLVARIGVDPELSLVAQSVGAVVAVVQEVRIGLALVPAGRPRRAGETPDHHDRTKAHRCQSHERARSPAHEEITHACLLPVGGTSGPRLIVIDELQPPDSGGSPSALMLPRGSARRSSDVILSPPAAWCKHHV